MTGARVVLSQRGLEPYEITLAAMRAFVSEHAGNRITQDQIWLVEHPAVFTLGLAGKSEHVLDAGDIPVLKVERGGQVTYHGPGQAVVYPLIRLQRYGLNVRGYVTLLEQCAIDLLAEYGIACQRLAGSPGVYVSPEHGEFAGAKIAALGIKITRGMAFHGLALNVAMDLAPYQGINPCGYPDMRVTDMRSLLGDQRPAAEFSRILWRLGELLERRLAALPVQDAPLDRA